MRDDLPPLFGPKDHGERSVFQVEGLLREARRQRRLSVTPVPQVCLLDPDGDVVRQLSRRDEATRFEQWACYHSEMWVTKCGEREIGIVPCAVGAPYAVLVAEELHASGCELIISVTSAGQIVPLGEPPYFVVIERSLRDEGTSEHYLAPSRWATLRPCLAELFVDGLIVGGETFVLGSSWTTDAPFRETAGAIAAAREAGVHAVEMEAAGLYAYAQATGRDLVCVAHITNTMAVDGDDFDKGDDDGTAQVLAVVDAITRRWESAN